MRFERGIGSRQPRKNSVLIDDMALPLTDRPLPYRCHSLQFVLRGDLSRGAYPQHIPSALYNARPRIALIDAEQMNPCITRGVENLRKLPTASVRNRWVLKLGSNLAYRSRIVRTPPHVGSRDCSNVEPRLT